MQQAFDLMKLPTEIRKMIVSVLATCVHGYLLITALCMNSTNKCFRATTSISMLSKVVYTRQKMHTTPQVNAWQSSPHVVPSTTRGNRFSTTAPSSAYTSKMSIGFTSGLFTITLEPLDRQRGRRQTKTRGLNAIFGFEIQAQSCQLTISESSFSTSRAPGVNRVYGEHGQRSSGTLSWVLERLLVSTSSCGGHHMAILFIRMRPIKSWTIFGRLSDVKAT